MVVEVGAARPRGERADSRGAGGAGANVDGSRHLDGAHGAVGAVRAEHFAGCVCRVDRG